MIDKALIGIEWEPQLTFLEFPNRPISVIRKLNLDIWGYLRTSKTLLQVGDSNLMVYDFQLSGDSYQALFVSMGDSYTPFYYGDCTEPRYLGVDDSMNNVEIRTRPVTLDLLKEHSDFCTEYLVHFVEDLSLLTKGVGVFLPKTIAYPGLSQSHSGPNKHVNISFPEPPGHIKYFTERDRSLWNWFSEQTIFTEYDKLSNFKTHINTKPSTISDSCRLHIMVPYNFTNYNELVEKAYKIWGAPRESSLKERMINLAGYLDSWYSRNVQKDPILVCCTTGNKVQILKPLF